ncbi:F-box DNA helicase 1 isoform 2-T2 [Pholidichthys leucotaenia]
MEVAVKVKAKRRHLNAAECEELGRSANGAGVLSQPHTSNQRLGSRDPNWGLYPRTPTKRKKFVSLPGSPSGQQKAINQFFSVTGIISSSPCKSSLPCTSTEAPNVMEDEEDDDDVSLLAVPLKPEPKVRKDDEIDDDDSLFAAVVMPELKEDEIDDESLLAAEMALPSEAKEEVDYLEGITAEMFGGDDDFEQCDINNEKEEEEVEPLPDAHYGLLGNNRVLLEPQASIDDIPNELLMQVLGLVPAEDLYCNVSLVCHRWRNIVQDPTFVPYKKQYYRYTMREKNTVTEIGSTLIKSGIIGSSLPEHSIRKLVVLMAQHKVGERVRPSDVLECVKKHSLFPQAEASIQLCIPEIQKHFNFDIEGPNPYAAIAIILILSEHISDVQALVSLLNSCMSSMAILEYLSHMATMLLAIERHKIEISNRTHYNIYYVMHLMENGPFPVGSAQSGQQQIYLTREQQRILSHDIQEDHLVKIVAFAGTGKTTTLVKYAEQRPHLRFLYVAFNSSVAREAQRRFPSNVVCRTVHSLAFNDIGKEYRLRDKLSFGGMTVFSISQALARGRGRGRGGFTKAKVVMMTLNRFMASADPKITIDHVPDLNNTNNGIKIIISEAEKPMYACQAHHIWSKMKDLEEKSQHAYFMTHDGYLKLWQLANPRPCLSLAYDAIFIDEAQDCTPAIMDVLLSQRCGKILVGDPHQQIYTFKGAVNALNMVDHTHIYYLTQSFRFGAEIAYVGATLLKVCKGVQKILVGGKKKGGVCDEQADKVLDGMKAGTSRSKGTTAILCRCNFGVFSEAVRLIDVNAQCRIHFIGEVRNIGLDKIMDIWRLKQTTNDQMKIQKESIRDPFIRSFYCQNGVSFQSFLRYIDQSEDKELAAKVNIVDKYLARIPELVSRLKDCSERDFNKADFIIGTVHKAKGLEFDTVMITDDFAKIPSARHELCHYPQFRFSQIPHDEWNLLYVAVTRARTTLIITRNICHILTLAGEYFLKSLPSLTVKSNDPLPCSVFNCPNCITPSSAFTMSKQQMRCSDDVTASGLLCERCVWTRIGPTAYLMTDDVLSMAEIPQNFHRPVYPQVWFLEFLF